MVEDLGREPTLEEYKVACESGGIPAAHLQSYLVDRTNAEIAELTETVFLKEHGRKPTEEELGKFLAATQRADPGQAQVVEEAGDVRLGVGARQLPTS